MVKKQSSQLKIKNKTSKTSKTNKDLQKISKQQKQIPEFKRNVSDNFRKKNKQVLGGSNNDENIQINEIEMVNQKKLISKRQSKKQIKKQSKNNTNSININTKKQNNQNKKSKSSICVQHTSIQLPPQPQPQIQLQLQPQPQPPKLQRGYKLCQNCHSTLHIHKYICPSCNFTHNMKKHKIDIMKNINNKKIMTLKMLKGVIEMEEFNRIKVDWIEMVKIYDGGVGRQDKKQEDQEKNDERKLKQQNGKEIRLVCKRSNNSKVVKNQQKVGKVLQKHKQHKQQDQKQQKQLLSSSIFTNFTNLPNISYYKSANSIILLQLIKTSVIYENNFYIVDILMYVQSVQKVALSFQEAQRIQRKQSNVSRNDDNFMKNHDSFNEQTYQKKQEYDKLRKQYENNKITRRALRLQKYNQVGVRYKGKCRIKFSVINIKQSHDSHDKTTTFSKYKMKNKNNIKNISTIPQNNNNNNISNISESISKFSILLPYHIQKLQSFSNKICLIQSQYKQIHLFNVDFNNMIVGKYQLYQQKNQVKNYEIQLKKEDIEKIRIKKCCNNEQNDRENVNKMKNYNIIKLMNNNDQFTCVQWLKLYSIQRKPQQNQPISQHNNNNNNNHSIYLSTGTLHGHIIIYSISCLFNRYSIYRIFISAHFQLISSIHQCPLSNNQYCIFSSSSHDGILKIFSLYQFEQIFIILASNRKIFDHKWDKGGKYVIVIRDQQLESCYVGCFYSLCKGQKIQLGKKMDFRLIRDKGYMYRNQFNGDNDNNNNNTSNNNNNKTNNINNNTNNINNNNTFNTTSLSYTPMLCQCQSQYNCPIICMLNSRNGFLRFYQTQQLRKISLKRKKSKKINGFYDDQNYKINLGNKEVNVIKIKGSNSSNANNNKKNDVKGRSLSNIKNVSSNRIKRNQVIRQQQEQQSQQIHSQQQQLVSEHHQSQINKKPIHKQPNHQKVTNHPIVLRKSTRIRKPIRYQFNYNDFIQDQSQQNQKQIKTIKKDANKQNNSYKNIKRSHKQSQQQSYSDDNNNDNDMLDEQIQNDQQQQQQSDNFGYNDYQQQQDDDDEFQDGQVGFQERRKKKGMKRNNYRELNINNKRSKKVNQVKQTKIGQNQNINNIDDNFLNNLPKYSAMVMYVHQNEMKNQIDSEKNQNQGQNVNNQQKQQNQIKNNKINKQNYAIVFISAYSGELIKIKIKLQQS